MTRRLAGLVFLASAAIGPLGCGDSTAPGVTFEESQLWTWSPCGTLTAAPAATAALFSADGRTVAVLDATNTITLHDANGAAAPTVLGSPGSTPFGALAFSPDGTLLALGHDTSVTLRRVPDGTDALELDSPAGSYCRADAVGFSLDGHYVFTHGGGRTCVWGASDGTPVAFLDDAANSTGSRAVVRGETIVSAFLDLTASGASTDQIDVSIRDFSGQELSRRTLPIRSTANTSVVLSPAGDRLAVTGDAGALLDVDTGAQLLSLDQIRVLGAAFTYRGDRVLMGDGLFRTQDGARLEPADALRFVGALAPDGETEAVIGGTTASLRFIDGSGFVRVFGRPTLRSSGGPAVSELAISADGGTLVSQGQFWYAFGLRLAPRFEDSTTLWWASSGESTTADISADGSLVAVSGDNRLVVAGPDGRGVMSAPSPEPTLRCWRTQLRLSATGRWAAGAGYGETMDVFDMTAGTDPASPFVALDQTLCQEAAAFSPDESLMATSGPTLYKTGAAPADWQPLWRAPFVGAPGSGDSAQPGSSAWGNDVRFSPDGKTLLVSRCSDWTCVAKLYAVADGRVVRELPQLTAPHPSFSGEGHWVVAGGTLLHLPSGTERPLDPSASITTAIFTPSGDIIAGTSDFSLTRYCRSR